VAAAALIAERNNQKNMPVNIFKIKRAFLIPLIAVTALLFVLFLLSLPAGLLWEKIILGCFFVVTLAIATECCRREMIVGEQSLIIKKFFRRKEFSWAEITQLAVVAMGKKVYFLLTTTKGFYIFSNLFADHALLVHALMDKLGEEKVEAEVKNYLDYPVERFSLIIMSWIAALVILVIIIVKLSGN